MAKRKTVTQRDPFGRELSTFEEEADDALDARGLLRDGRSLRVPLFVRDGLNPELTTVQRGVAQNALKPLVTDGSSDPLAMHRPGFRYSTDAAQRAAADAALTAAHAAKELADRDAWQSRDDHPINTQGRGLARGPKQGDPCTVDGKRGRLQMVGDKLECIVGKQQDAQTVADCYAEYDREAETAWRSS